MQPCDHHSPTLRFPWFRHTRWWTALVLLLTTLHCGGGPLGVPAEQVEQLSLSPFNPQIAQDTGLQLTLRSHMTSGRLHDRTAQATWSVTTEGGAALPGPQDGLLELGKPGRYQVTAAYGEHRVQTVVTVTAATLTGITISPSTPQVAKGLSQAFNAKAAFSDGTTQDVTPLAAWSIKDVTGTGVAVINTLGIATTKTVGKARVTVRYKTFSTSTTLEVTAAVVLTLSVSPSNPVIALGSAQPFAASAMFTDGTVQDVTADADWAVTDRLGSGVASVDGMGVVTGTAVGQATVGAAYSGQLAETNLTVTPATVVSLAISPSAASVVKGTTQPFTASAVFSDGSRQDVTAMAAWTSADVMGTGVAAVTSSGLATGNAVGTATISCAYKGLAASATVQVTPAVLTALAVSPASASVAKGIAQQFTVVGSYSDGSQQDLNTLAAWTTSDVSGTSVASVSAAGLVLGKNVGQAAVKATYQGKSATATVTVNAAIVVALTIAPVNPSIKKGATQQFTATGILSDWSTQVLTSTVSWSATDVAPATGVASLSRLGLATGNQLGQATIAARYLGLSATTLLTVKAPTPWTAQPSGTSAMLTNVWGSDPNNIWAVGELGTIVKWNGTAWTVQNSGTTQQLFGVFGTDASNVWAVGNSGTILRWNGTTWTAQSSGVTWAVYAIWGTDPNHLWASGVRGVIKWNGTAWTADTSSGTVNFYGAGGLDGNNVWMVGDSGTVLKWNGTTWSNQGPGGAAWLHDIWAIDPSNVWAVGGTGTIQKWSGTTWSSKSGVTTQDLRGIWASDANNVWAAGGAGTIIKWDGTTWTPQTSGTTQILWDLWGSDANNVWAVGDAGTILRYTP